MLDTDFRPWLIEVNTNPSTAYQNKWHRRMVDTMLDELLTLTLDPLFPQPQGTAKGPEIASLRSKPAAEATPTEDGEDDEEFESDAEDKAAAGEGASAVAAGPPSPERPVSPIKINPPFPEDEAHYLTRRQNA